LANFIDKPVDTVISLGTQPISTTGFEIPLFATPSNITSNRTERYSSTVAMIEAGYAAGSPVVKFAEKAFGGVFPPPAIKVGLMAYTDTKVTFTETNYSGIVSVNISTKTSTASFAKTISVTMPAASTATQTATALSTAIEADTDIGLLVNASSATSVVTIAPTLTTTKLSVGYNVGTYLIENTGSETPAVAIPLIANYDNDWYFLASESHSDTDVKAVAAYATANYKMHTYSTNDELVKTKSDTTNIAYQLQQLSYNNSCGVYHALADIEFPEGGIIGACASNDPSYGDTLMYKSIPGVPTSQLTESAREAIWSFNLNFYQSYQGTSIFRDGKVASGQFFDTIRFSHWFKFRSEESVFGYLKRRSDQGRSMKMSDDDLPVLKSVLLNNPINIGVRNGSIVTGYDSVNQVFYDPIITIPRRAEIPVNDLAARVLDNVTVQVVYNQSLHYVKIRAFVELDRQPSVAV
jgi:hypothetical protein